MVHPVQKVSVNVLTVRLVEYFVAVVFVELDIQILDARLFVQVKDPSDALSIPAYRIILTGYQ